MGITGTITTSIIISAKSFKGKSYIRAGEPTPEGYRYGNIAVTFSPTMLASGSQYSGIVVGVIDRVSITINSSIVTKTVGNIGSISEQLPISCRAFDSAYGLIISKANVNSIINLPTAVKISKLNSQAILTPPQSSVIVSKAVAYAVIEPQVSLDDYQAIFFI